MNLKKSLSRSKTLKSQKKKKRDLTPEPTIVDDKQQDMELNQELQKKVHLGEDFIE